MLFTQDELEYLRQKGLNERPDRLACSSDSFFFDSDNAYDEVNTLWASGEPSDLFRGGNEFWELYPTVN